MKRTTQDSQDDEAKRRFTRRAALQGGAAVLAAAAWPTAQAASTLRWLSTQSSPEQMVAYRYQIKTFEEAHPGVKIAFEPTSDEGYATQLAAAFAGGNVPNIVTHLPSFAVADYWQAGLVEPIDPVLAAIGKDRFIDGANQIYELEPGVHAAACIGNTAANMLWLRTDMMAKAGIEQPPGTWDELRSACRKMQGRGIYGAPLPYARNSMTSLVIVGFIHQAGGQVFTPDLDVALVSDEAQAALEFYKSMREFCPVGATSYSWGESLTAFVSGATATGLYSGRVLINATRQNPRIADHITCTTYPCISTDVEPWTYNDYPCVFIPADAPEKELTRKFAAWLFKTDGYIRQVNATPGHVLPVIDSVARDSRYLDNPVIRRYETEISAMSVAAAEGKNLGWETPRHKPNTRAGAVIQSGVLAEMVQRVTLNDEDPRTVLGNTARKIEAIMKN
jgi:multiple sugar transport system substrate-binding protein